MGNGTKKPDLMWSYLIHLGYNMWREKDAVKTIEYVNASDVLILHKPTWDEIIEQMPSSCINTVIIDLGEGVKYESHPEIAVEGSWSVEQLRAELKKMRDLGLNPIPKLNFSATHDEWLGDYARCVSSKKYYEVCRDLINEVIDIFDTPDFFHIGMDEETMNHQRYHNYVVIRQGDYWWKDLYFCVDTIEKKRVRAWVWYDNIWNNPAEYVKKMPKSVLQSNWFYGEFNRRDGNNETYINAYLKLDEHGFEQVPTGSNWSYPGNFPETVAFAMDNLNPERLKGFMQTPWKPTVKERKLRHLEAIELMNEGYAIYEEKLKVK
ncbi:MAG: Tat pathway signal protein [Clostridiales bacterium]|nr:Tat pathway signal protein [Clostridiales bacterium]